jgi:hypothetical protein
MAIWGGAQIDVALEAHLDPAGAVGVRSAEFRKVASDRHAGIALGAVEQFMGGGHRHHASAGRRQRFAYSGRIGAPGLQIQQGHRRLQDILGAVLDILKDRILQLQLRRGLGELLSQFGDTTAIIPRRRRFSPGARRSVARIRHVQAVTPPDFRLRRPLKSLATQLGLHNRASH